MDKTSQNQNTPAKPAGSNRAAAEIFDWVQTFCQALFAVVFIFTFLFRFVTVDGHSMDMTLADGDRLIISNIGYTPTRGDIVVIHDTESRYLSAAVCSRPSKGRSSSVLSQRQAKRSLSIMKTGRSRLSIPTEMSMPLKSRMSTIRLTIQVEISACLTEDLTCRSLRAMSSRKTGTSCRDAFRSALSIRVQSVSWNRIPCRRAAYSSAAITATIPLTAAMSATSTSARF